MSDVNVFVMNLPPGVNEAITQNEDGTYTIFIEDRLSPDKRILAYAHALRHIQDSDFDKEKVQDIESMVHESKNA